jgi:hypothetical protein
MIGSLHISDHYDQWGDYYDRRPEYYLHRDNHDRATCNQNNRRHNMQDEFNKRPTRNGDGSFQGIGLGQCLWLIVSFPGRWISEHLAVGGGS